MKQIRRKEGILPKAEEDTFRHESLNKFVTGKAEYIDDLSEERGTLHAIRAYDKSKDASRDATADSDEGKTGLGFVPLASGYSKVLLEKYA